MQLPSTGEVEPVENGTTGAVPPPRPASDPTGAADGGPGPDAGGEGWVRRMRVEESAERNDRGAALFAAGRHREAAALFERALDGCRAALGPDHAATLTVAGNLAVAQVAAGQRRRGLKRVADNLADRVRVLGDEHPDTLTARDALAAAHRTQGNVDDAVAVSDRVALQRARTLGPAHPDTLTSRMGLALAHAAAGDVSAAHRLLIAALSDSQETHGPRHPCTALLVECGHAWGLIGATS
jgi:tetratricopeptide (TPR) repeat protein